MIFLVVSFLGIGYTITRLPGVSPAPPGYSLSDRTCITGGWKFALVLTHILIFLIIPITMKVFYETLTILRYPTSSVFASQLGLAFVMVAIASEIGWHVTQCWYYSNDFTLLNFMFYFFEVAAFALWSDGLLPTTTTVSKALNILFAVLLFIVSIMYPVGYATGNSSYKIPIYISMTIIFTTLSWRGYKMLNDWRIIFFPVFSVGVNLFFVALLQSFGGDPFRQPRIGINATCHILHDLLGTEAGVVVFTLLVYLKGKYR